jgi:hypothetical protein
VTDAGSSSGRTTQYRFSRPGGVEIETVDLNGDDWAETYARELSASQNSPVVIHRLRGIVDWEYVTEVDERA